MASPSPFNLPVSITSFNLVLSLIHLFVFLFYRQRPRIHLSISLCVTWRLLNKVNCSAAEQENPTKHWVCKQFFLWCLTLDLNIHPFPSVLFFVKFDDFFEWSNIHSFICWNIHRWIIWIINSNFFLVSFGKVNQEIEVRPGVVSRDQDGKLTCRPILSKIVSLYAEQNDLQYAVPGGLIGQLNGFAYIVRMEV